MAKLTPEKLALLAQLRKSRGLDKAAAPEPTPDGATPQDELPLSFPEERSVRLVRLTPPDSLSRRVEDGLQVRGPLDARALEQAFNHVLRRHDVLWSQYAYEGDRVNKRIVAAHDVAVPVTDLRQLPQDQRRDAALDAAAKAVHTEIDITSAQPLLWLKGWRIGDDEHLLYMNAPHCVVDVESFRILWTELSAAYQHFARGAAPPPEPRPKQYAEFSRWQRQWYQGDEVPRWTAYWKQRLEGCSALNLRLPTDRSREQLDRLRESVHVGGTVAAAYTWSTPAGLAHKLSDAAKEWKVPPFAVAYAALGVLMARRGNHPDVTVATLNNVRNRVGGLGGVVGCFNNNMLLRLQLSGDPSFAEVVSRARKEVLDTLSVPEFQLIPFVFPKFNDLFRVLFNFVGAERPPVWPGMELEVIPVSEVVRRGPPMKFHADLLFRVAQPDEQTLRGTMLYNSELWSVERVGAWAREYDEILAQMVAHPQGSAGIPTAAKP